MRTIETMGTITEDGRLVVEVPGDIPQGQYRVRIEMDREERHQGRQPLDLPVHDSGPWPNGLSLRREDLYDDAVN